MYKIEALRCIGNNVCLTRDYALNRLRDFLPFVRAMGVCVARRALLEGCAWCKWTSLLFLLADFLLFLLDGFLHCAFATSLGKSVELRTNKQFSLVG